MPQRHALVLIADPNREKLTGALLKDLKSILGDAETVWLGADEAAELRFETETPSELRHEISEIMFGKPFDWAVVKEKQRKKRLLVSDMDSTMIEQECIDELADFAGLKQEVSAITEAAMNGAIDFKGALRQRVALLKGMDVSVLEKVFSERITLMPGAKTLLATMKANGAASLLVSGGFTFFTSRVAEALGFDEERANILDIAGDGLAGSVSEPILDKESKELFLTEAAEERSIPLEETLAVGDGANDLPMLKKAGLGVAFHAKEIVRRQADAAIDHGDLTALLYLQGYAKDSFVTLSQDIASRFRRGPAATSATRMKIS